MWGAYFCMGAYKRDVVVVIQMGAYIFMGCLFCVGAYYSDFTVFVYHTTLQASQNEYEYESQSGSSPTSLHAQTT